MRKKIIILSIILLIVIGAILVINMKSKENHKINNSNEIKYENSNFNLNLIKTVNNNNLKNYLISPYSIEIALSMLKEGANGNTLTEIENVIDSRNINDISIKDRVSIANAGFIKNEYKKYVKDKYYQTLKDKYNSEILYDNFDTPKVINNWVNERTDGMIEKILDDMDANFVLGIANAIAIDVEWDSPFDCIATNSEKFTKSDNSTIDVEMMHKTLNYGEYKYLENGNATGVIIPYKKYNQQTGEVDYAKGNNLEFVAILPNNSVNNYINDLNETEIKDLFNSARNVSDEFEINLAMPRFKYDYTLENFIDTLKTIGIKEVFDKENADLTNIIPRNDEIGNLYVGEAIHKTHIDLNEKGTKAAAVTYFGMFKNTAMPKEKEKVNITFDRPFIYMILDSKMKEMLFFGTVYEPNKWNGTTCSKEN